MGHSFEPLRRNVKLSSGPHRVQLLERQPPRPPAVVLRDLTQLVEVGLHEQLINTDERLALPRQSDGFGEVDGKLGVMPKSLIAFTNEALDEVAILCNGVSEDRVGGSFKT